MPTITYDELISSFLRKGEILNLFTEDITDEYRNEFLWGLIYSAVSDPYVSRLFNNITINPYITTFNHRLNFTTTFINL